MNACVSCGATKPPKEFPNGLKLSCVACLKARWQKPQGNGWGGRRDRTNEKKRVNTVRVGRHPVPTPEFDKATLMTIREATANHFAKKHLDRVPEYLLEVAV